MAKVELPELLVEHAEAWEQWLAEHQDDSDGVWLILAKKKTTDPTMLRYADALDVALCYGWIDGQAASRTETFYAQKFTPRRARSMWSKRNVEYIARLTEEGRMQPRGIGEVEKAKADGRWDAAYAGSATITIPEALTEAFAQNPVAAERFESLNRQERYSILHRVHTLKTDAGRARNVERIIAQLSD